MCVRRVANGHAGAADSRATAANARLATSEESKKRNGRRTNRGTAVGAVIGDAAERMRCAADRSRAGEDARLSAAADAVPDASRGWWWLIASALFVIALALVLIVVAARHSAGNAFGGPPPLTAGGEHFKLVRGTGARSNGAYVVEALDASGIAVLAATVRPFAADRYPRVEWHLRGEDTSTVELSFLWRTLEQPSHSFHVPLEWRGGEIVAADLDSSEGWNGTITAVALVVHGALLHPLTLESCVVPSVSGETALVEIGRQWSESFPFKGTSIHLPFDAERSNYASLLIVVAVALGLAMGGYYVFARRGGGRPDPRVLWAIFLLGWFTLDLRWQANLWRQLAQTTQQFAGKTLEEKHLAADDHALYELMQKVNAALPPQPVRILVLAENSVLRTRGAFFLYPQNVYHDVGQKYRIPDPDQLHSGDYAVLLPYSGLTYDSEEKRLLWPDGRTRPADEIVAPADGILLLRAR